MIKRNSCIIIILLILSFFSLTSAKEEKADSYLSCILHVMDEDGEYSVNVSEYKGKDKYCRRDNWESQAQGPVSYIIIRETGGKTSSYTVIHSMKKIYAMSGEKDAVPVMEEDWLGDLHLKLIEREELSSEKWEGYMCKKTRFINRDTDENCTVWFSEKLSRWLKITSNISDFTFYMEMTKINTKAFNMNIFNLPKNYKIVKIDPKKIDSFPVYER
ncbi:MAG: hypothetical protein ABRQ38_08585 [Candidatus Eremiobacterota bacterium]